MGTRFRGPLEYARVGAPFNGLPMWLLDPGLESRYKGIAIGNGIPWLGPAAAGTANGWVLTNVGVGTSTLVMNNTGKLVLTGGTTDEDNSGLQFTALPFIYSATLDIACFARIALSTALTTDAFFGLAGIDTTLISASAIAVDNCLGFFKAATSADYTFHSRKTTTSTTQAMGLTLTDAAYAVIGFTVIAGVITAYAVLDPSDTVLTNDALLGSGLAVANTNAPNTVDSVLTLMVGQEGGTTARTATVDWAFAAQLL
jgi:hypothetical protein